MAMKRGIKPGTKLSPAYPGPDVLREMYETKKMSSRAIGRELGCSGRRVLDWLREAGATIRSISEGLAGKKPAPQTILASVRARRKHSIAGMPEVGYKKRGDGYVGIYTPGHPAATKHGYVLEHRLVVERSLGRFLLPHEEPHHKNEIRDDNRIENLELKASHGEHMRDHHRVPPLDENGRFLPRGQTGTQRKTNPDIVAEMKRLRGQGWTLKALAEKFKISMTHAHRVTTRR